MSEHQNYGGLQNEIYFKGLQGEIPQFPVDHADLVARAAEIDKLRANNEPTVPTTIGIERKTNPFMRPASKDLRETIGLVDGTDVEVFAETRQLKDKF